MVEWKGSSNGVNGSIPPPSPPASRLVNRNKYQARGGQKSIVRPMRVGSSLADTDVMIQERRKQQKRFQEAQSTQREMSQLERQYEEFEEYGREIEQQLRDSEGSEFNPFPPRSVGVTPTVCTFAVAM